MMRYGLLLLAFTVTLGKVGAQSSFTTHRLCAFEIQLPYFVTLTRSNWKSATNKSYCAYEAKIPGYGQLSIGSNSIEDDYFKGDPLEMFESLREYSNVTFDDDRSELKKDGFVIYGDDQDGEAVFMAFVYSANTQASIRYDYPMLRSKKIQLYIDALLKTFKAR